MPVPEAPGDLTMNACMHVLRVHISGLQSESRKVLHNFRSLLHMV